MDKAKLPPNSLYLHDLFADVASSMFPHLDLNKNKNSEKNLKNDNDEVELENEVIGVDIPENEKTPDNVMELESEIRGIEGLNLDGDILDPDHFINKQRSFPEAPHSQNLVKMEAEKKIDEGKEEDAGKLYLLSQAITFQHQVLCQYSRKLNKNVESYIKKCANEGVDDPFNELEESLEEKQRRLMLFKSFENTDIGEMIRGLPQNWVVVQISCKFDIATRFKKTKKDISVEESNPGLTLIRMSSSSPAPVTLHNVEPPSSFNCQPYLQEFQSILSENSLVNKKVPGRERAVYWKMRSELDARMRNIVRSMEDKWLGVARTALLGKLVQEEDEAKIKKIVLDLCSEFSLTLTPAETTKLETIISGASYLSSGSALHTYLSTFFKDKPNITKETIRQIFQKVTNSSNLPPPASRRHPVLLILDPGIQSLPWESLPCLTTTKQPMSRLPSLPFLNCLWQTHSADKSSVVRHGVATDNIFYLLNPDKSLPETEKRLDKAFKEFNKWEGVVGHEPAPQQLANALSSKDAFMYCGHGSGNKYLSGDDVEKLTVRAVPMLMGCSSGQLTRLGRSLDPLGTAQSYLVATSPAMLGFLWAVTDADVDQWTVEFMKHWLSGAEPDLMQASADKREAFRQFLNSAALVVYGLPLRISNTQETAPTKTQESLPTKNEVLEKISSLINKNNSN